MISHLFAKSTQPTLLIVRNGAIFTVSGVRNFREDERMWKERVTPRRALEIELTKAMYAAAEKAGMARELASCEAEIGITGGWGHGEIQMEMIWEAELREIEEFVFPHAAWERAKAWGAKMAAKRGYKFAGGW